MSMRINLNDKSIKVKYSVNEVEQPKAEKPKKSKKILYIILGVLLFIAIGCGTYIAFKFKDVADQVGIKINAQDIIKPIKQDPQLKKDSTGTYTNALIIGLDTREKDSGLLNTDTIIIASYNHKTGDMRLISVPRDFYVEVPDQGWYTKINGIYAAGENVKEGDGITLLKKSLEQVTGMEIQYYGMVDLKGFIDLVDTLGGIDVMVENTFTDYMYPVYGSESQYETVTFKKGLQKMDGATALKFVRSRHSMDNGEGSDFARARRQQRVIMAIKDKILSSDTLLNPMKALEIINVLSKNIKLSEITSEDIQAGINIAKKGSIDIYSFVLDPTLGNFQLITDKGFNMAAYVIAPVKGIGKYEDIQDYLKVSSENPMIYSKNPIIFAYDTGLGYAESLSKTEALSEKLPYIDIRFMGTLYSDKTNEFIFSNQLETDTPLLEKLGSVLGVTVADKPDYVKTRLNGEDFVIFYGAPAEIDKPTDNGQ